VSSNVDETPVARWADSAEADPDQGLAAHRAFLLKLADALRPLSDPLEVQEAAVRLVGEHLQVSRVGYAEIENGEYRVRREYVNGVAPLTGRGRSAAAFGTAIRDVLRRGETLVITDVQKDPRLTEPVRVVLQTIEIAACIGVVLMKAGRPVGAFGATQATPRHWTPLEIGLIRDVAERTWEAVERARVEGSLRRSTERLQFLVTLNDKLRPLTDAVEMQDVTVRLLAEHLQVNRVGYATIQGDEFTITASYADGVAPLLRSGSIMADYGEAMAAASKRGETIVVNDVRTDQRFTDLERRGLAEADVSAMVNMMLLKEGQCVGAFGVHSKTPRIWTRDEIELIEQSGERTWLAAEQARAVAALHANDARLAFLLKLDDALRPLSDPLDVQEVAARLLAEHLQVSRVGYAEIEGRAFKIRREYTRGVAPLAPGSVGGFGDAMMDSYRSGATVVVNDVQTDPRLTDDERAILYGRQMAAFAGLTLIKDGRMVAAFGANNVTPRMWTASEIELIRDVAERTWGALERARAEASLRMTKERLQFLVTLNDELRPLRDPIAMQEVTVRLLGEHLGVNRVSYATIHGDEFTITRCYASGVAPFFGRGPLSAFGAGLVDTYKRGETVAVDDVRTDARITEAERSAFIAADIAAFVGVMLLKEGKLIADFCVHNATPRFWTRDEIDLIEQTSERMWSASEQARAEAALAEREQRLRLALDASAGGSWTWDAASNSVDWDEGFRTRYGFTPEEPSTVEGWLSRVHDDDRPQVLALLDELQRSTTRASWENTFRIVRPDGTILWIQSLGRADRDANGRVTRLTGLELDATERRRAEEALQARRDEERDRELRLLLESAAQGVVSVDACGLIVMANRALESMFGWEPGELIGHSIEQLVPVSAREAHRQHRMEYFASPRPRSMGMALDLVGQRKDGTTFPLEVSLNHTPTPGGGHAIAFVTDITARRAAEAALEERTVELEQRTIQLSQLASDLTLAEQHAREQLAKTLHDGLQQLLVSASLNLDRQLKRDREREAEPSAPLAQSKRHLDEAIAAARSLSLELFPPLLHGSGLPAALVWLAERTGKEYGIVIQISADPLANSDRKDVRTLLFESVRELLLNAVKHGQIDRVSVELSVRVDDMLCITVADEGRGFDPSELIDRTNTGHVGWGLFRIRERLTLFGGRFDIESAPGRGTRVQLIAPRGGVEGSVAAEGAVTHSESAPAFVRSRKRSSTRPLKILIVDDHAAVRRVFRDMLRERRGLRVVGEAVNGRDAIAQAHELKPDVILMDVLMPEMDGIEATRRIHAELPFIQILAVSTHPPEERVHAIERAGAAAYFTKGIDTQRLLDHLMTLRAASGSDSGRPTSRARKTTH
jgi:PAS domain S-box-containing protein